MISLVIPTYNRASTLPRAISSVIKQDYRDWELLVVDDGSTDDTRNVLAAFKEDSRIVVLLHSRNRGVAAALNTGLERMRGEWFTVLGSDDEILPAAFSSLLKVRDGIDPAIDAITCNCLDTTTGGFSGKGLEHDQYLDAETILTKCRGEFWGLTKTSLLGKMRFNEKLRGWENTLWSKIDQKARRYYVHAAFRIYHTEGGDRLSKASDHDVNVERDLYAELLDNEPEYLALLKRWDRTGYERVLFNACAAHLLAGDRVRARAIYRDLHALGLGLRSSIIAAGLEVGPDVLKALRRLNALRKRVLVD